MSGDSDTQEAHETAVTALGVGAAPVEVAFSGACIAFPSIPPHRRLGEEHTAVGHLDMRVPSLDAPCAKTPQGARVHDRICHLSCGQNVQGDDGETTPLAVRRPYHERGRQMSVRVARMSRCPEVQMSRCQDVKVSRGPDVEMSKCQNVKMSRCQDVGGFLGSNSDGRVAPWSWRPASPHPGERRRKGKMAIAINHRRPTSSLACSCPCPSRAFRVRALLDAGSRRPWPHVRHSLAYNERHFQALEKRVLDVPQEVRPSSPP